MAQTKVTDINIQIDKSNFDWGDVDVIESLRKGDVEEIASGDLRRMIAHHMIDSDKKKMPEMRAMNILKRVAVDDMQAIVEKFMAAMQDSAMSFTSGTK